MKLIRGASTSEAAVSTRVFGDTPRRISPNRSRLGWHGCGLVVWRREIALPRWAARRVVPGGGVRRRWRQEGVVVIVPVLGQGPERRLRRDRQLRPGRGAAGPLSDRPVHQRPAGRFLRDDPAAVLLPGRDQGHRAVPTRGAGDRHLPADTGY